MERHSQQFFNPTNAGELMLFVEKKRISLQNYETLEHDNVQITPAYIEFVDPREGQVYEAEIKIANCGSKCAVIRIELPMSFAFSIKPIVKGRRLPPGLSIKRIVTYNYTKASISPYAEIPIYVNDHLLLYPLFKVMSEVQIEAIPNEIDFGNINVQQLSQIETFLVRNLCGKAIRFIVDIYRSEYIFTVEPTRGVLKPKESIKFTVQMMSEEPGECRTQFWIKCQKPIIVKINANVLLPHFKILHPPSISDNTMLLDFGKTYFGASVNKTLVIRNHSACKTMYCTLVELGVQETMVADDYRPSVFTCSSAHGRFDPLEDKPITVTFCPIDPFYRKGLVTVKHYFNLFKCIRVNFQDIVQLPMNDTEFFTKDLYDQRTSITNIQSQSSLIIPDSGGDSLASFTNTKSIYEDAENTLLVFLNAEAYTAAVDLVPSEISIQNINLMETATRVIKIKNTNSHIPVYFEYRKTAFIELDPTKGKIEALSHFEVLVKIIAAEPGKIKTKITFDLLYPNLPPCDKMGMEIVGHAEVSIQFESQFVMKKPIPKINHGITPVITNETGFLHEEVAFNTTISLPLTAIGGKIKDEDKNSNIIAFPNDRPKSLRPRRNLIKRCTTIFAKIPRNLSDWDEYDLSDKSKKNREDARTYINMYVEKRRRMFIAKEQRGIEIQKEKNGPDYELTNERRLLLKNVLKDKCPVTKCTEVNPLYSSMLPLSPKQLHHIKVYPSKIFFKYVFVNTSVSETINIENLNNFSLWINLKSSKNCINVVNSCRKCVRANTIENFRVDFNAPSKAKQVFASLEVIVNDCHFTEVDFTAEVIEMTVLLDQTELVFGSADNYKVLTLKNVAHTESHFSWKLSSGSFRILPMKGKILPLGILKCAVYKKECEQSYQDTEAQLNFKTGALYKTISLNIGYSPLNVILIGDTLKIPNLPLNITKKRISVLRNLDNTCLFFTIVGQEGIPGLTVSPTRGILKGKQDQIISIYFHFETLCELSCTLRINLGHQTALKLIINARVEYPKYQIVPDIIHFKKIACSSTSRIPFTIENKCSCRSHFRFPLADYPTYSVKESDDYTSDVVPQDGLYIDPGEKKKFHLFFTPVEIRTVKFYLPIVVNNLLGPASVNVVESKTILHFIEKYNELYNSVRKFKLLTSDSQTLSTVTIVATVTNVVFGFSKVNFHFKKYLNGNHESSLKDVLTISNIGNTENEFCIRTDDIKKNISLLYTGTEVKPEFYENSISAVLNVGEKISLDVVYRDTSKESEIAYAPVFIRRYEQGPLFRYLSFKYTYFSPTIASADEIIFFPPVPPCCGVGKIIILKLSYHVMDECSIITETELDLLTITMNGREKVDEINENVYLNLFVNFKSTTVFDTTINVRCSCGASVTLGIKGCAENCLFTINPFMTVFVDPTNLYKPRDEYISCTRTLNNPCDPDLQTFCVYFGTLMNLRDYCYPFFPRNTSDNRYYDNMETILNTLERIIYIQCFKEERFIKIPDGFTSMPTNAKTSNSKQKESGNLHFEELLINFFGKSVAAVWCGKRSVPDDNTERLIYIYETYSSILTFVKSMGGVIPHVCAEYLFSYDDYMMFINEIVVHEKETYRLELKSPYNEQDFYYRSKQCWIDLLLQIFKITSLFEINDPSISSESIANGSVTIVPDSTKHSTSQATTYSTVESSLNTIMTQESWSSNVESRETSVTPVTLSDNDEDKFSNRHELFILYWLETSYNTQIKVWKNKRNGDLLHERKVKNFRYDLRDCLVLLATISFYCPFLDDRIEDVIFDVQYEENRHHNAIILSQWLHLLKMAISVTPEMIAFTPTGVYLLMLSSHLFHFLPSLYPRDTIYMEANINKSTTKTLMVRNTGKEAIMYTVTFFNNTLDCFSTNSDMITVPGKKTYLIKFIFQAKSVKSINTFVILNGESKGYRNAKCMAYVLYGITKFEECSSTVTFSVPLYKSIGIKLPIKSPHMTQTKYRINYSIGKAKSSDEVQLLSWKSTKTLPVLPSRIYSAMDELECDPKGTGILELQVFCLSDSMQIYILFFTNPELGDFGVELRISSDASGVLRSSVYVDVKEDVLLKKISEKCICGTSSVIRRSSSCINLKHLCPKYITILIPRQNNQLWNGVGNILRTTMSNLKDWNENFATETLVGSKLLYFAVDNVDDASRGDIDHLYEEDVLFDVQINSRAVTLPHKIFIQKVRAIKEYTEVVLHLNATNLSELENFKVTLTSGDLKEKRYYNVEWHKPKNLTI